MAQAYDGRERLITVQAQTTAPHTLTIGTGNAGVTYTEDEPGGTIPRVAHVNPGTNDATLTVTVDGLDITVNLATDGTGVATSTAAQVRDAVNAVTAAGDLVTASLPGDGTGLAATQAMTELSGGGATSLEYVAVDLQTSASLSSEREEIDTAHKGSGHATSIVGQGTDSISLECYDAKGNAEGHAALKDAFNKGDLIYLREEEVVWDGDTKVSQTPLQQNTGYITSISRDLNRNEAATFSLEVSLQQYWSEVAA